MSGKERRNQIVQFLTRQGEPVSGTKLAQEFGVSRQVIVQDIALLRSSNITILSTNRGYLVSKKTEPGVTRIFKCHHSDEETEQELNSIVDQGGTVIDVFVHHKVYGKLQAPMHIRSRRDVREYMERIHSGKSALLKNVTSDYHYHTICADSEDILNAIEEELDSMGYLVEKKELSN
jgi:hypothetical protein